MQTQAQQFAHVASVPHSSQDLQPHLGNYQVATATQRVVHSGGPRGSHSTKARDRERDTSPTASSLRRWAQRWAQDGWSRWRCSVPSEQITHPTEHHGGLRQIIWKSPCTVEGIFVSHTSTPSQKAVIFCLHGSFFVGKCILLVQMGGKRLAPLTGLM